MNTSKLAMQVATENNLKGCAYKYDLFLREYDNKVELLGLVDDPTHRDGDCVFSKVNVAPLSSFKINCK